MDIKGQDLGCVRWTCFSSRILYLRFSNINWPVHDYIWPVHDYIILWFPIVHFGLNCHIILNSSKLKTVFNKNLVHNFEIETSVWNCKAFPGFWYHFFIFPETISIDHHIQIFLRWLFPQWLFICWVFDCSNVCDQMTFEGFLFNFLEFRWFFKVLNFLQYSTYNILVSLNKVQFVFLSEKKLQRREKLLLLL